MPNWNPLKLCSNMWSHYKRGVSLLQALVSKLLLLWLWLSGPQWAPCWDIPKDPGLISEGFQGTQVHEAEREARVALKVPLESPLA